VIRARFQMVLPGGIWVSEVSISFPDATLRLLTGVPKGDRALELGEVRAADARPVADAIRAHPDVSAYEELYAGERRTIAQYEADEKALYEFLGASSLPPEFPILVEDGEMEFGLTATQAAFDAFGEVLEERGLRYELLALVYTDEEGSLLTERQRKCLIAALREGYFEVPRDCTLSELADVLGVDKSTASETIRCGQARVLEEFFAGQD